MEEINVDTPTVLSLAAGGGGLDRGFRLALPDARTVCYVEISAAATAVLVKGMEENTLDDAPVWSDARTFDGKPWRGVVDWVIGGYPCQPFSIAGRRAGHDDPRNLWPAFKRIIGEVRPRGCFFENVGQHLRDGYFDTVRPDLESLGYRVEETLVTAAEIGAPHKRERIFILATDPQRKGKQGLVAREDIGGNGQWGWSGEKDLQSIFLSPFNNKNRWPQPILWGVDDGMAQWGHRLGILGNGVVPQQAALAFRILSERTVMAL
jgi:site-specific DNA-cytosine methylase